MADTAASLKVYAEDSSQLGEIERAIKTMAAVQYATTEELGFGIKILRVTILLDDSSGGTDQLEEKIRGLPGVSQVEVEKVTRI